MSQWVVFTQEKDGQIGQVWIFENDGIAAAWLDGQRRLKRNVTMVKAPVVKACGVEEKVN